MQCCQRSEVQCMSQQAKIHVMARILPFIEALGEKPLPIHLQFLVESFLWIELMSLFPRYVTLEGS